MHYPANTYYPEGPKLLPDIDAWLFFIADNTCNLHCNYCFNGSEDRPHASRCIDIKNMLLQLHTADMRFAISFTGGGEPFLIPNIIEAAAALTKALHYISFNTNLVLPDVRKLVEHVKPEMVSAIMASFHSVELEKINAIDTFIENAKYLKKNGFYVTTTEIAHPTLRTRAKEYRSLFERHGLELLFAPFSGIYKGRKYPESYTQDELRYFQIPAERIAQLQQKGNLCNAGVNYAIVQPNGDMISCLELQEPLGNIYTGFTFTKKMAVCPVKTCNCPINVINPVVFEKALYLTGRK